MLLFFLSSTLISISDVALDVCLAEPFCDDKFAFKKSTSDANCGLCWIGESLPMYVWSAQLIVNRYESKHSLLSLPLYKQPLRDCFGLIVSLSFGERIGLEVFWK